MRRLWMGFLIAPLLVLAAQGEAARQGPRRIPLRAQDLVYEPVTQRVYASVPGSAGANGNSIAVVNPQTGRVESYSFVGSEPGKLALAGDGQQLYVALRGASAVRRFNYRTRQAGLQFSLVGNSEGPYQAEDLEVLPGAPGTVVVSLENPGFSPNHVGVAVYDEGVRRAAPRPTGSNVIEFNETGSRLYGYDNSISSFSFMRMTVERNGIDVLDAIDGLISGFGVDIEYSDGRIYASNGQVIDAESRTLVGTYPGVTEGSLVEPDANAGRTYFLTPSGRRSARETVPQRVPQSWSLKIFDRDRFTLLATVKVPGVRGVPRALILCGASRLAFCTSAGQVIIHEVPRVPPPR